MAAIRSSPRTPSKNKGVGPSGTEGIIDGLDNTHKANWDTGRRVGTTITRTGYNKIALKFAKRTGRRHDITQLKNKYSILKKEWQAWIKLMDTSKGVTGIGFDRDTGLFTGSEEWWDNLKSTNKLAYKFDARSIHRCNCDWQTPLDAGGEVDSPRLAPFTEPYRLVVNSLPNSPTVQLDEADPGTKRKKRSFNHLSKGIETQKHLTVRHGTGASQKYGIEPCMQRLMAIPDFISTPLFHFACTVLENADYQEILMCMPDDENVVGWLAALQVSKGLSHQRIMWKGQSNNYRNYDDVIIELHAMEYYLKYIEKILCRTSILTGRGWIQELFDGHIGRREQNLHMPLYVFQVLLHHCIGALDVTYVEAMLPARDAGTYYDRKGYLTQNILAVCDFDISMHDSRIFN
ncbi:hypothetical protein CsSME_00043718 [Camellia sinensis var. sinensis]